jgi:ribosomal S7p/S5e-like protein
MPRKGHIAKRTVDPDPVYQSDLVTKFVNSMMWQGKKSTAQGIFYESLTQLQNKGGDEALKLFKKAARWRRELPGAGGSECRPAHVACDPLDSDVCPRAQRKRNDRQADQRVAGCRKQPRRGNQEERRCTPHGGSQQGIRALPVVMEIGD